VTQSATPSRIPRQRPTGRIGLYDPAYEHDACWIGAVAKLDGVPSHETVVRAIRALENLEHRGATGADPKTGDGAGILIQLPDEFFRGVIEADLPQPGKYGVAVCFLPQDAKRRAELEQLVSDTVEAEGQRVVAWRDVPLDLSGVGQTAASVAPSVRHCLVAAAAGLDADAFER
jgi:glutamate synthase domain-containing protein 1